MKVAIIGAGPAGLACAITSAKNNEVWVFERNKDAGKKLLLTGSGRCNIGNLNNDLKKYNSSNREFIKDIINDQNIALLNDFFSECGIVLKNKNGYLYPYSEKASSVLSCLKNKALSLNVIFKYETLIERIKKVNDKFLVDDMYFDKVVITCGGLSYPSTGSDGVGYSLAKSFNHHLVPLNPSLVSLISNMGIENNWKGVRIDANVSLYIDDEKVKEERGELQLTDYGLSGICIFNISRYVSIYKDKKIKVKINFVPFILNNKIKDILDSRSLLYKDISVSNLCDGFLDYKLTNAILKFLHIDNNKLWNKLSDKEKDLFANSLSNFEVDILGTKSYDVSQVTSGGVCLDELNLNNLSSKYVSNLHFAGEILDLDGDCGGYNLTIAFITGLISGGNNDKN